MAVTIAGVVCQEIVGDYREGADIQAGFNCTKSYLVPWGSRFAVAHGILGLQSAVSVGGLISFNYPIPYPELASESTNSLASCYARSIDIKGVGPPVQGAANIAFTSAIITVMFGAFPFTFQGTDLFQLDSSRPYQFCEQHFSFSTEYITVPGRVMRYVSTGSALKQDWGFASPRLDMTITCKQVPYLPAPTVLYALQNPVNSVTYLGVAPGYLMFNGAQDDSTLSSDGTQTRDVTFSFAYRPIAPWDYIYNGDAAIWDQVVNSSGNSLLNRSDLSTLIPSAYIA
jgi:hypothetical protein